MTARSKNAVVCALFVSASVTSVASAAKKCVNFDDLALNSSYSSAFVSGSVNINVLQMNNTIGDSCTGQMIFGAATVQPATFSCSGNGSAPNEVIIDSVLLDFNMADFFSAGPVNKVKFKHAQAFGNIELVINGQCFVRSSFAALPNGVYGGVKYKSNACAVVLRNKTSPINSLAIGGEALYIDDVCASN